MLCKLTNQDITTHGGTEWEIGVWKETDGSGDMCGAGWLHCYDDPLLAVLHNPIHANIDNPRLWEIEVDGERKTDGLKSAYTRMRLVREIPIPEISTTQKVVYAILCAKEVCKEKSWLSWADGWLSGKDRTAAARRAALAAADAADAAAWEAAWVRAWVRAAWATRAAAWAARAAAARRAALAAWEAAAGVALAAKVGEKLDFLALAKKAMGYKE